MGLRITLLIGLFFFLPTDSSPYGSQSQLISTVVDSAIFFTTILKWLPISLRIKSQMKICVVFP